MLKNKFGLNIAFSQFIIIALFGVIMRLMFIGVDVGLKYKHMLHGHSHVGFLGWVSVALGIGLVARFTPEGIHHKTYRKIFILTEISIIGMLISFPIQGYALYSISFSTLYMVGSLWFAFKLYKELRKRPKGEVSTNFAKASLFYLLISSIGPLIVGPIKATGHGQDPIYFLSIFFYLHFLYNGFVLMGIMALIFKYLEDNRLLAQNGRKAFLWTNSAVIPTYILSTLWTHPALFWYWLGGFFAIGQFIGLWYFLPSGKNFLRSLRKNILALRLVQLAIFSFGIKLLFQVLSAIPTLADNIKPLRNTVVIGYLHLVTLGIITFFLLGWFILEKGFSTQTKLSRIGLWLFIIGVIISETLLFGQGFLIWFSKETIPNYGPFMAFFSSAMLLGLILFGLEQWTKKKHTVKN